MKRLVLLSLFALTCCTTVYRNDPPTQGVQIVLVKKVGPSGAVVQSPEGELTLTIPFGALDQEIEVSLGKVEPTIPGSLGQVWEIGPTGTKFRKPATLSMKYDDATLGTPTPESLAVATVVDNAWEPLDALHLDPFAQEVSGQTLHLSPFAIIAWADGPDLAPDAAIGGGFDPVPVPRFDAAVPGSIGVGDLIDLNGDGIADGIAIDANFDGLPDGVDVNGDGVIDAPLPGGGGDGDGDFVEFDAGVDLPTHSIRCDALSCDPLEVSNLIASTLDACCTSDEHGKAACGLSGNFLTGTPACLMADAPGVVSDDCGAILDLLDDDVDQGTNDGRYDLNVGSGNLRAFAPGCCTPAGTCSANFTKANLNGLLAADLGYGCADPVKAGIAKAALGLGYTGGLIPCDAATGVVTGGVPGRVDAGVDVGDAGI